MSSQTGNKNDVAGEDSLDLEITNSIGMRLRLIPPGVGILGTEDKRQYIPEAFTSRRVKFEGFYMSVYEVTQSQWEAVMKEPADKPGRRQAVIGPDYPMADVSWHECQQFIERLNELEETDLYHLPTEEEWEYACRGPEGFKYSWGNGWPSGLNGGNGVDESFLRSDYGKSMITDLSLKLARKVGRSVYLGYDDGYALTAPVGSYNPNWAGLYDPTGNVDEWCADWFYPQSPNPADPLDRPFRVTRGGGFNMTVPDFGEAYMRYGTDPDEHGWTTGFRVVRKIFSIH